MNHTSCKDTEIQFGRDDSPSETIVYAFADTGQVTITVQNTEVHNHACDNELSLGQAIQLRDFLNRHIDGLALAATGSLAVRSSDDPSQLSSEEQIHTVFFPASYHRHLPILPPPPVAPAGVLHLVWSLDKTECVGFYDKYQADWASDGELTGSAVSALAMAIREDQARQHRRACPILPRTKITFY